MKVSQELTVSVQRALVSSIAVGVMALGVQTNPLSTVDDVSLKTQLESESTLPTMLDEQQPLVLNEDGCWEPPDRDPPSFAEANGRRIDGLWDEVESRGPSHGAGFSHHGPLIPG